MRLETQRLCLTTWEMSDAIAFRPIATDPKVMRYITDGRPLPDQEIQDFVRRQMQCFTRHGFCLWKPLQIRDGQLVGFCGLQQLPWDGAPEVEIGWWLSADCWGKGLATEAAQEALRDGFERAGLKRIVAIARPANAASLRVMQKLGMVYEREFMYKGIPHVLYSISLV